MIVPIANDGVLLNIHSFIYGHMVSRNMVTEAYCCHFMDYSFQLAVRYILDPASAPRLV